MSPADWATVATSAIVVLGFLGTWVKWIRPRIRRSHKEVTAVRDAILGRDAIVDSITGEEIKPALPGVGKRMAQNESDIHEVASAVKALAETVHEFAKTNIRLDDHETRISKLETAAAERIANRIDSASAFRAIEAVAKNNDQPEDN